MEHYYVISGNEYGADLSTKKNFKKCDLDDAIIYFDKIKFDDCYTCIKWVDLNGEELTVQESIDE